MGKATIARMRKPVPSLLPQLDFQRAFVTPQLVRPARHPPSSDYICLRRSLYIFRGAKKRRCSHRITGSSPSASLAQSTSKQTSLDRPLYFATCARGLGQLVANELEASPINANVVSIASSGVSFTALADDVNGLSPDRFEIHAVAMRACLWLRTAMRVLLQLHSKTIHSAPRAPRDSYDQYTNIYRVIKEAVDWPSILSPQQTFSIAVRTGTSSNARSQGLISESALYAAAKDAVCDALRDAGRPKPQPPRSNAEADIPLFITVHEDTLTLYLDMAGVSLHKRGYRAGAMHKSALNESVAAGMLYFAGFEPNGKLFLKSGVAGEDGSKGYEVKKPTIIDPMCGSGTILIEAALLRLRVAPGLYRREFAFERWSNCDRDFYEHLVDEAIGLQKRDEEIGLLLGSDKNRAAVAIARRDIEKCRLAHLIRLRHADIDELQLREKPHLVISNPPWGMRIDEQGAWERLGKFMKENVPKEGSTGVVMCGDGSLTRELRMRARQKHPVRIGNVDTRVLIYNVMAEEQRQEWRKREENSKAERMRRMASYDDEGMVEGSRWERPIF